MKVKTELFLYRLLWFGSVFLASPSSRRPAPLLEGGAFSNGLLRQIQRLESQEMLEKEKHDKYGRLIRLSEKGQDLFLEEKWTARWQESWQGNWTMVLFDISEKDRSLRDSFRKKLHSLHFGCLQKSLWISPFPQPDLVLDLKREKPAAAHCTILQAKELLDLDPFSLVQAAWNLKLLEQYCRTWESSLKAIESLLQKNKKDGAEWDQAVTAEFGHWKKVSALDPFLPVELQPKNYAPPRIWNQRQKLIQEVSSQHFSSRQSKSRSWI